MATEQKQQQQQTKDQSIVIREKLTERIEQLEKGDNDNFGEILADVNALLISANHRDVQQVTSQMNLAPLFDRFNALSADDELFTEELLSVFGLFLESLPINDIFVKYNDQILQGLRSSNVAISNIWTQKVVKPLFTNEGLMKNISKSSISIVPILTAVIELLLSPSTSIASASHDICVITAKIFRQEFFSPQILDCLKGLRTRNFQTEKEAEQFLIRFYELIVDIAASSQLLLDMLQTNGLLTEMIEESKRKINSDPLVAMNFIKLLTDLASKPHGLEFVKKSTDLLPLMARKIETIDTEDLLGSLILPGCINFFIRIAQTNMSILLNEYPQVLNKLTEYCRQQRAGNTELQLLAIESAAFLCQQSEGKSSLADRMPIFLDTIVMMINGNHNDLKSRAIVALNEILQINGSDPGNKATELTKTWYSHLDSSDCGLDRFMKLVQEPFIDVRIPAINFIRILATSLWGQKLLSEYPGFLDYLLDRSTETCKQGREAKFEIVSELAMSPFVRISFPAESVLRIRGYLQEGPINKEVNVAFESS
ncbi:26S proteasome non-ATPase regulatory subunit 5-like protein [Euroglyphus maynei]|uniref:26S proteasome non-ATPase regulatory subunit 5 n=1 Tax=Euroglyphus maynei TaxID=6958 RepID=A0A1Y3BHD3_EURMA|nr:26S proteasome non-ATPase regulatory subunit 5-like protein [Euroglyphus maynei]